MTYKLCTKLNNSTYTLVLVPHFSFPQISPTNAMRKAISVFKDYFPTRKLHVVDSAFGSFQELSSLSDINVNATFSMSANEKPWLWELLKRKTKMNHWNGATLSNGIVASIEVGRGDNNQLRYHHLATNAFETVATAIIPEENEIPTSEHDTGSIAEVQDAATK